MDKPDAQAPRNNRLASTYLARSLYPLAAALLAALGAWYAQREELALVRQRLDYLELHGNQDSLRRLDLLEERALRLRQDLDQHRSLGLRGIPHPMSSDAILDGIERRLKALEDTRR